MKVFILILVLLGINFMSVFGEGTLDSEPVNKQEIGLDNIDTVSINYRSDHIILLKNDTDSLIIKEYMSADNSRYYAKIRKTGNEVIVESGRRPWIGTFICYIEVYLPASLKNINIKSSSGKIEARESLAASSFKLESTSGSIMVNNISADTLSFESSSGSIRCERASGNTNINGNSGSVIFDVIDGDALVKSSSGRIEINQITGSLNARVSSGNIRSGIVNGNATIHSDSGSIIFGAISGNAAVEASSGRVELGPVNGKTDIKSSSGSVHCTAGEKAGDISITASSGSITLNIPRSMGFNYSSRTSSGGLHTPFSDKLFSPVSDKNMVQGVIEGTDDSENQKPRNISLKTSSGSIRVNWAG